MEQLSTSISGREDYFRFLDLSAELRNCIYDFAAETQAGQPRCVLPCLALAQTCQQIRSEYWPICLRRDIVIDWVTVSGYMRTFFSTVNGKIENLELAPSSMTIVTPWRGEEEPKGHELDTLPIVKTGVRRSDFTCHFIHDEDCPEVPHDNHVQATNRFLKGDSLILRNMICHRNHEWVSDVDSDKIAKIVVRDIGFWADPSVAFHMTASAVKWANFPEDYETLETYVREVDFERFGISGWQWGDYKISIY